MTTNSSSSNPKNWVRITRTHDDRGVNLWTNGRSLYFDNEMWAALTDAISLFQQGISRQVINYMETEPERIIPPPRPAAPTLEDL